MIGGPYEFTSGWVGPLRITVTILPSAVLACVALAVALRQHAPLTARKPSTPRFGPFTQPLARCWKKARMPETHECTSLPAPAGTETIQTTTRIPTTQPVIFASTRFPSAQRCRCPDAPPFQ